MKINDTLRAMLDSVGLGLPDLSLPDMSGLSTQQIAQRLRASFFRASRAIESDAPELADVSALIVDGGAGPRPARFYTPLGAGLGAGPAMVYFHGGGFVVGDLDSHDMIARRLAHASRARVISVDYRLAPEHKFPAAHEDADTAWRWIIDRADELNIDPDRLAVAGDSAGGNLAASLSQEMLRTGGPLPAFQLLLYPLVQFMDIRTKKMPLQESGFFISPALFDYFRKAYLGSTEDRSHLRMSPLFAPDDDFAGLPPAHIITCGWDPLGDEGRAYADKLAAHGVPVTIEDYPNMVHGFLNVTAVSKQAREALQTAGEIVGRALGAID
jgi:acetyl esterase